MPARNFIYPTLLSISLLINLTGLCQVPYNLIDNRQHKYCEPCQQVIHEKPPEVLFGININANGDIYFSMANKQWFDKLFKSNSYGITTDLVSKDRYTCDKMPAKMISLPMGTMIQPVYKKDLVKNQEELSQGDIYVKIGTVPKNLKNKQLEANLVILNGNFICYYSNFVNIDRSVWQLLPMGLFTDSLLDGNLTNSKTDGDFFTYTKKIQLQIPFSKGSTVFNDDYMRGLSDSLDLLNYKIQKIEVRAYSSVEGPEKINMDLMNRRADAMIKALEKTQPGLHRIKILTAENWLEFFKEIEGTEFDNFRELSKLQIKQKLSDATVAKKIEPLLSKERKVLTTIYLDSKSPGMNLSESSILSEFQKAITEKDVQKARAIQKALVSEIIDKKLPLEYMGKLEVPASKEFSPLLNDREVYKYLLKATTEYEALEAFLSLKKIDPDNGRINYNICVLRFFMWQYGGDTLSKQSLMNEIKALSNQGINATLVKRMLINYHILKCEDQMRVFDYAGKDSSLNFIHTMYEGLKVNDEDIYSLAKYYAFYAHQEWAEEIIEPRIDKVDVSEDLVFYYVNLLFFQPSSYDSDEFYKAALNAINLNKKRFCDFFLPNDKGGASMQLLEYEEIKKLYCEECK